MIVDSHCHIGDGAHASQSVDGLLKDMDRNGVERAFVCPSGRHIVVDNSEGNDLIADSVRAYPDRFYGFACINPWYGDRGIAELKRSFDNGLIGLKLHPSMQGYWANDPLVYPVVEAAIDLGVPIYIHSGTPVYSLPLQIVDVAERYPEGRFIMGHMGGADFYVDVPSSAHRTSNVYYETSLTCHVGYVDEIVKKAGHERVLFGSDSPTSQLEVEILKIKMALLTDAQREDILGTNALRLLGAA